MGNLGFSCISIMFVLLLEICSGSVQRVGNLNTGFQGSHNDGLFLLSNNSNFAFGFDTAADVTQFLLVVIHRSSSTIVWAANRGSLKNSDNFQFDDSGNAFLQSGSSTIWSTDTGNKGVSAMQMLDNGNLVLVGTDGSDSFIWQSFTHPTNTLLPNQEFSQGMTLISDRGKTNLTYSLEIKSDDMILSAGFHPPQPYWSMGSDTRITINKGHGAKDGCTLSTVGARAPTIYIFFN